MKINKTAIVIFYVIFLMWFFSTQEKSKNIAPPQSVRIIADAKKYTLPSTPVLSVINDTDAPINIDTCRDIEVINGITRSPLPENFCRTITLSPRSTAPVIWNLKEDILYFQEKLYAITQKQSLDFVLTISGEVPLESQVQVGISKAGIVRVFFRKVFYDPVYNLFVALTLIFPGYSLGWAIIAITLIIRLGLLIPQQNMLISQRRMQLIQPKIKAIQEEYKWDQAKIGAKMIELYKREGVNPLGSCLPILIQIPILIVLYQVILNISNPTNFTHLYDFSWLMNFRTITLETHFFWLQLEKSGGMVGVVLWLVTGLLQFGQMWLSQKRLPEATSKVEKTEKNENMPDMQQMQKVMIYIFPAMAAVFAFQFPAGVWLYWLIGTIFMIVQQYIANRQAEDKKMVIRDKAGNIIG